MYWEPSVCEGTLLCPSYGLCEYVENKVGYEHFFSLKLSILHGVQSINNVVVISGEQGKDSAIHIHGYILPQTPLPSRLPHSLEHVLFSRSLLVIHFKYSSVGYEHF